MNTTWYGRFSLPGEAAAFWQAGPYQLWAKRFADEIKVASAQGLDAPTRDLVVEVPSDRVDPPPGATVRRFGFQTAPEFVTLTPVLADRPVVVSPEDALCVPPGEQITVFISTPIWVELTIGDSPTALIDEPTSRPTDTWFGPSPMKGELCYATRTSARRNLDNVTTRPHRAISVVEIRNKAKSTLAVEKLKIPLIHQSLYAADNGDLWTEKVTLDNHDTDALVSVHLGKGPPPHASDATLVRGPRTPVEAGLLTRAFGGLVS